MATCPICHRETEGPAPRHTPNLLPGLCVAVFLAALAVAHLLSVVGILPAALGDFLPGEWRP